MTPDRRGLIQLNLRALDPAKASLVRARVDLGHQEVSDLKVASANRAALDHKVVLGNQDHRVADSGVARAAPAVAKVWRNAQISAKIRPTLANATSLEGRRQQAEKVRVIKAEENNKATPEAVDFLSPASRVSSQGKDRVLKMDFQAEDQKFPEKNLMADSPVAPADFQAVKKVITSSKVLTRLAQKI